VAVEGEEVLSRRIRLALTCHDNLFCLLLWKQSKRKSNIQVQEYTRLFQAPPQRRLNLFADY